MSMSTSTSATASNASGQRTLTGIAVHIVGLFFGIIGVGIAYLLSSSDFSKSNARNALNWQLFVLVGGGILLAAFFLVSSDLIGLIVGFLLLGVVVLNFAFCFWATVKAAGGDAWQYPIAPEIV